MMTPRKKSIAKKVAAGMIAATLSASAFPLVRPNASKQLAIRTGDYEGVLNTLAISNNAKTNLRRAVSQLASINPVAAVGAEIAQIDNPALARRYADSLYRYADDIQTEFAINARNVVEKAQKKLANACETPSLTSSIIYGDCGDVQAKAVRNFINFKKQFVRKTRKETLSNIRNQIEFVAIAPKVSTVTDAEAEKIASRFLRERRIMEDGRITVYSEEIRNYLGEAVRYYVKVLLAIMAMASFISWKLAEIFKPDAIKEIVSKKPHQVREEVGSGVIRGSSSPNKNNAAKKIQSAVRKSQFRKKLRTALKNKGPAKPSSPPKKSLGASGSGSRSVNKNTAPPRPPTAPKKPPSRNNLFAQIKSGTILKKRSPIKSSKKAQSPRNNILSQIKAGKTLRKVSPKKSPKKSPESMMNPVLVSALSARRAALSPNSPN